MDKVLLTELGELLNEEKWTRATIENYTKKSFSKLDEIIEDAIKNNTESDLGELCLEHITHNPQSIIALYIKGSITFNTDRLLDDNLLKVIQIFKENKKWTIVEFLSDKVLEYGENKKILEVLRDYYENTGKLDELQDVWKRLVKIDYENGEIAKKLAELKESEVDLDEAIHYYKMALKRYAKKEFTGTVEELWIKLVKLVPEDVKFFESLEKDLARRDPQRIVFLYKYLLDYYESKNNYDVMIKLIKKMYRWIPNDKTLRDKLVHAYNKKHEDHSQLSNFLEASGLQNPEVDSKNAIQAFEQRIVLDEGKYVVHRSWGIGKISELYSDSIIIDFVTKKNHTMSMNMGLSSLKVLPDDNLYVIKHENPESLKKSSEEGMAETLFILLKSIPSREANLKLIKKELMGSIVPEKEWTKWWAKAKKIMKDDGRFGTSLNKRDLYFLRDKPLSIQEELFDNFKNTPKFEAKVKFMIEFLKGETEDYFEQLMRMTEYFQEIINRNDDILTDEVLISYLILRRVKKVNPTAEVDLKQYVIDLINEGELSIEQFEILPDPDMKKDLLVAIRRSIKFWDEIFSELFLTKISKAHNYMVDELLNHDKTDILMKSFKKVLSNYRTRPENYLWAVKTIFGTNDILENIDVSKRTLIENSIHLIDIIYRETEKKGAVASQNKKILAALIDFLTKDTGVLDYLSTLEEDDAKKIVTAVYNLRSQDDLTRQKVLAPIFDQFSHLKPAVEVHEESADEEVKVTKAASTKGKKPAIKIHPFLVTKKSFQEKEKELQNILNVELPQVSIALGIAQEEGDLRENFEYHANLEKQKQLQAYAQKLDQDLRNCKLIDYNEIKLESVDVGTEVKVQDVDSKEEISYTVLGEWDSDLENNIISYKSPFGQALVGTKLKGQFKYSYGDVDKKYKVLDVQKADKVFF